MAYRMETDEAPGDAVRRIAAERVASALTSVGDTDAPVGPRIHQLRKRCKQTRSLVRLVRTGFPDYKRVNKSFRKIARRVSSHRDARVMAELVRKLAGSDHEHDPEQNPVVRWFEFRAETAEKVAAPTLIGIRDSLTDAAVDIENWPVDNIQVDDVIEGLWQTIAKVNATTQAVREGGPLHEWRKRCKDLWYQLRVLENLLPPEKRHFVQHFDVQTEFIGDAHDRQVLVGHLDELSPFLRDTPEAREIADAATQEQSDLGEKALILCDDFLQSPPEELTDGVVKTWRENRSH